MLQHKLGEGRGGVQLYEGKEKRGGGQWLGEEESITFREKEKREGRREKLHLRRIRGKNEEVLLLSFCYLYISVFYFPNHNSRIPPLSTPTPPPLTPSNFPFSLTLFNTPWHPYPCRCK